MATQRELDDIKRWEGSVRWMYLDVKGLVTVGVGNLLRNEAAAQELPFLVLGTQPIPAAPEKIAATWRQVHGMMPARSPEVYRLAPSIELAEPEVDHLLRKRIDNEFLPGLARMFVGFESFPEPARGVLLDMAFNMGLGRDSSEGQRATGLRGFSHLRKAVADRDWMQAARSCKVTTSRPARNAWRIEMFMAAAAPPPDLVA